MNHRELERCVAARVETLRMEFGSDRTRRVRLLVGVSGGADSVALLCALLSPPCAALCEVTAVNCNFHLRGDESDRDSESVRRLCERLGVPLVELHFDVDAYVAAHPGVSVEMACRELRYDEFRRLCREGGYDRVAVAHNADDNAETLLLNLMRGSGTRGLKGMLVDADGVFRPLLQISRAEIEEYLAASGETYVTDSSNLSADYRRNFLRLEVLPLLESRWPAARALLARSANIVAEENVLVTMALQRLCPPGTRFMSYSDIADSGAPLTLILHFIAPYGGTRVRALEMVRALGHPGGAWRLRDGVTVVAGENGLRIEETSSGCDGLTVMEMEMTEAVRTRMLAQRGDRVLYLPRPLEEYEVRRVKKGDRMSPLGMNGSRLVSKIIKDAHVPREVRRRLRVVVERDSGEIVWLEGLRRSRFSLVHDNAIRVWMVSADTGIRSSEK